LRYLMRDGAVGNQALAVNLDAQRRIDAAKAKKRQPRGSCAEALAVRRSGDHEMWLVRDHISGFTLVAVVSRGA